MLSLKTALEQRGRVWWVAPSYPQSSVAWRELKAMAQQLPERQIHEDGRRILLPGGGEITIKSADAPVSLKGEGLDLAVVDEAAYTPEDVWTDSIRPALADRIGGALIISTPAGYNWFHGMYARGQEGRADWQSWCYPTSDNPLIRPEEIEAARDTLPARTFNQEFLALFTADGGVFRNVGACVTAEPQTHAIEGHAYHFGVDWAGAGRDGDYTVIAVFDITEQALVSLDRFRGVDYTQQRGRLQALYERFKPMVITAEQNSMGAPIIEALQRDGLPVRPFVTTNATKAAVIDALALAFERGSLQMINDGVLLGELASFVAERLPSGLVRYGARSGHDDTVMSLSLAYYGAARSTGPLYAFVD